MALAICHWVRELTGGHDVPFYVWMGLKQLIQALLPARRKMLERHHEAGNDAEMHWRFCRDRWENVCPSRRWLAGCVVCMEGKANRNRHSSTSFC